MMWTLAMDVSSLEPGAKAPRLTPRSSFLPGRLDPQPRPHRPLRHRIAAEPHPPRATGPAPLGRDRLGPVRSAPRRARAARRYSRRVARSVPARRQRPAEALLPVPVHLRPGVPVAATKPAAWFRHGAPLRCDSSGRPPCRSGGATGWLMPPKNSTARLFSGRRDATGRWSQWWVRPVAGWVLLKSARPWVARPGACAGTHEGRRAKPPHALSGARA